MNDSVFEAVEKSSRILRLDFSSIEFAKLAEEQDFSEEQIQAVGMVFEQLQRKKVDTTIHTLLKMSRLPPKDPKTFENFDFSVIKGRDANRLKTLPSLSDIYAHRNLAFIGPAGTGKTHLAQAFGYECCQRGIKTYFIIGMSTASLYKTFLWEGAYYGIFASVISAVLGYVCCICVGAAKTDTLQLVTVPVMAIIEVAVVSIAACLLATAIPLRSIAKMNIVGSYSVALWKSSSKAALVKITNPFHTR